MSGLNDCTRPSSQTRLGTPHSTRFKNIFKDLTPNPTLLEITRKLYDVIEGSILLPKKGGEKISSLGSETAADIKILLPKILDLVEKSANIPLLHRCLPFEDKDKDHQVKRVLAGENAFSRKMPNILETRLDNINKTLNEIKATFKLPSSQFRFNVPSKSKSKVLFYAFAASKHAPNHLPSNPTTSFRPTPAKKQPTPPPPPNQACSQNTVKIAPLEEGRKELASMTYPTLIKTINNLLTSLHIKENPSRYPRSTVTPPTTWFYTPPPPRKPRNFDSKARNGFTFSLRSSASDHPSSRWLCTGFLRCSIQNVRIIWLCSRP